MSESQTNPARKGQVRRLKPEGLPNNPAFSHAISVSGPVKTVYVGGQNAVDADGHIVGEGDIGAQTEQVFKNLEAALAAAGAGLEHVVHWTIHIVQGQPLQAGFEAFGRAWGKRPNPAFLVEVNAVAVVPE